MAFKLRSPLHTDNPYIAKSKAIVARHAKAVADYKPGSTAKPTYGTARNIKEADLKAKGERTNLPLEKPKLAKPKSYLPASQGGSPMTYRGSGTFNSNKTNLRLPRFSVSKYMEAPAGTKFAAATSGDNSMPKTSGPKELRPGGGVRRSTITSEGYKIPGTSDNKRPEYKTPGTGSSTVKPKNTVKPSSNTNTSTSKTKSSKPTTTLSTGSNTNADKSGGYLKDTKNFSLGVDTKLSTGSMPKFERTVTNARSADYDMIRAKGRGKIDRLKTRLDKREGRVANRVEASSMRIKSRQQRSGNRYASKMEARTNTGTNPGKFESQKKLDAFEKAMDSPKATAQKKTKQPGTPGSTLGVSTKSSKTQVKKPSATLPKNPGITSGSISPGPSVNVSKSSSASSNLIQKPKSNQTVAKPSMKLNTSRQTSITINDSKIKKGAKQAKGGGRVSKDTYQNLTGFKKLENKKPGSSKGMRRGMSTANTSIKVPGLSRGPLA